MNVFALAGGVGGAKLAHGLSLILPPENLTIVVNTGDDFEHLGLTICPDLDTVIYTLAGVANPETGWGRAEDSHNALMVVEGFGGPTWFHLGDKDLGLHLERTRRLRHGQSLSEITHAFCSSLGVGPTIYPMSDDPVRTWVSTDEGELPFQEYFVHRMCEPEVKGFRFLRSDHAEPAPGVFDALRKADLSVICPSNPWVSIDPILTLTGMRYALQSGPPVVAVTPIIAGKAIKGPAAKMYAEMGIAPSAVSVARHYGNLLSGFVLDEQDADQEPAVRDLGVETLVTDTIMKDAGHRHRLAQEVLDFGRKL